MQFNDEYDEEDAARLRRRPPVRSNPPPTSPSQPGPVTTPVPTIPTVLTTDTQNYFNTLQAGEAAAADMFKDGSFGRVQDERQAETNGLIAQQKARLGGITPEEQEAARVNALYSINDTINPQMASISNQAAGRGLRGGVVAAAQAPVLGQAQGAYAGALQDLMQRTQQSQVDAANNLAGTLGNARDRDLNVQDTNLNAQRGELMGRLSFPFDYASASDASDVTNAAAVASSGATAAAENVINEKIKALPNTGKFPKAPKTPTVPGSEYGGTRNTPDQRNKTREPVQKDRSETRIQRDADRR